MLVRVQNIGLHTEIFGEWLSNDLDEKDLSIIAVPDETKTGHRDVPCFCAGLFKQIEYYYNEMNIG